MSVFSGAAETPNALTPWVAGWRRGGPRSGSGKAVKTAYGGWIRPESVEFIGSVRSPCGFIPKKISRLKLPPDRSVI